jgi:hypothetical protein
MDYAGQRAQQAHLFCLVCLLGFSADLIDAGYATS